MSRRSNGDGAVGSYVTSGGKTRWRCQWRELVDTTRPELGKKLRSKGGFTSREEASHELRLNLTRVAAGQPPVVVDRMSFEAYARRWLEGYSCEPTTRAYIKRVIDSLVPYIGGVPISQLMPSDLAAAYRGLEAGKYGTRSRKSSSGGKLASSTVMRYSGWAVTIFNGALDEGLIARNPASHKLAGRPKGARAKRVKPFTVWDAQQTAMFCDWALTTDQGWARAWSILVRTGLRSGELLALRWSDIDLNAGTLTVDRALRYNETLPKGQRYELALPKGGRSRRIGLDRPSVELLASWRRTLTAATLTIRFTNGPVFTSIAGQAATQSALLGSFLRAQAAFAEENPDAHLPKLTVHDLRHTHASLMLAAGVDVKVIQERLGHSSATVTLNTYAHLMPNSHQTALGRFESLLSGGTGDTEFVASPWTSATGR